MHASPHNFWAPWVVFSTLCQARTGILPVVVPPRSSMGVSLTTKHDSVRWYPQPDGTIFKAQYLGELTSRRTPAPHVTTTRQTT
eukprot:scaffold166146_cov37-Prasinocladus_malaysianus.AAC.1